MHKTVVALLFSAVSLCLAQESKPADKTPPPENTARSDNNQPTPAADASKPTDPAKPATGQAESPKGEGQPVSAEGKSMPAAPAGSYLLGADDVIQIRVWGQPEGGQTVIRPDGRITVPFIGEVEAKGLTTEQLGFKVAQAYEKFLRNPLVSVTLVQANSQTVYVTGEVLKPGPIPLRGHMKIADALAYVGMREFAKEKGIILARGEERFKFNYKDFKKGKNLDTNRELRAGDQIIVP